MNERMNKRTKEPLETQQPQPLPLASKIRGFVFPPVHPRRRQSGWVTRPPDASCAAGGGQGGGPRTGRGRDGGSGVRESSQAGCGAELSLCLDEAAGLPLQGAAPLWEHRSWQACSCLFLSRNAAVGKAHNLSMSIQGHLGPGGVWGLRRGYPPTLPEGLQDGTRTGKDLGATRQKERARVPAPVPSQPRERAPTQDTQGRRQAPRAATG